MSVRHNIILYLIIIIIIKVTADNNDEKTIERRFSEEMNDGDWHIAHLKDVDFNTRRSGCKEETVAEKIKKYRKNMKNDAGLIEFVNANPLPFNEKDLDESPCKDNLVGPQDKLKIKDSPNVRANSSKTQNSTEETSDEAEDGIVTDEPLNVNVNADSIDSKATTKSLEDKKEIKDTATTPKEKQHEDKNIEKEPEKADAARRASEYVFSSIEYYDETLDFDASVCPDAVEVIELEQDIMRNYDVDCELTLEWTSLE